jgi:hypothetical protein
MQKNLQDFPKSRAKPAFKKAAMVSFSRFSAVEGVATEGDVAAIYPSCDGFQVRLAETPPRLPRELEIAPKQIPTKIATASHYESNRTNIHTRSKPRLVRLVDC